MKKLILIIVTFISLLAFPSNIFAASGTIRVTGASTAVVGNKVTMTVTLASGTNIGSWQMDLNYDKSYLQLVSSSAEAGGTKMSNSSSGTKSKTYTFAFKTLKKGTTSISVSSFLVYDYDTMSQMTITPTNKTLRIMTQEELEATYSKNNDLKSLTVEGYELDKEFNKDTLEYTVTVPTGTTSVKVNAAVADSTASVNGAGEIEVTEGLNSIPLVVTAQNGDQKTYTLVVNVEDQNPINVKIDNKNYVVVKNATLLEAPLTFTATTITINDFEIPAFINNNANITLVGLKDESGNIIYCEYKDNSYHKFNEMTFNTLLLIPVKFTANLDLIKTTITINDEKVEAYKYSAKSDFVIINAKNLTDGKTNLYLYDPASKTATIFDDTYINEANATISNYTYIIIAFAGALGVMFLIILILLNSLRKKQKKIKKFLDKQEAKIEATRKLNDVVAEVKKITAEEKHTVKPDTTELPNTKKANKKKKKDEVVVKEIASPSLTPAKETKTETKNEEPKTSTPTPEKPKTSEEKEETEVYNLFEDDFKKKKKKKK